MYLLADPKAKDAQEVQRIIYKIEARKEEAAAQAAERRRQEQARLEEERKRQKEQADEKRRRELASYQKLSGKWCFEGNRSQCADMKISGSDFSVETFYGVPWPTWYKYSGMILSIGNRLELYGTYEVYHYQGGHCREKVGRYASNLFGTVQAGGRKLNFEHKEYTSRYYDPRTCSGWFKGEREAGSDWVR